MAHSSSIFRNKLSRTLSNRSCYRFLHHPIIIFTTLDLFIRTAKSLKPMLMTPQTECRNMTLRFAKLIGSLHEDYRSTIAQIDKNLERIESILQFLNQSVLSGSSWRSFQIPWPLVPYPLVLRLPVLSDPPCLRQHPARHPSS